jgi:Sulfotransferase domain
MSVESLAVPYSASSDRPPMEFLVIGAQKCATSWLYGCLKDHPDIKLPATKREVEYLGGDLYDRNGADWYFDLVKNPGSNQVPGDVSVNYISDPKSPPLVRRFLPEVKIIACLRDPIDRAISASTWYTRKGLIPEAPVEEILRRALHPELAPTAQFRDNYEDLLYRGQYDVQLARYREFVAPEKVLFVLYDDVELNPRQVLRDVYEFIGVDRDFVPASLETKPKHNTYFRPLILLQRLAPKSRVMGKLIDAANQILMRAGVGKQKPVLSKSLTDELVSIYSTHVQETSRLVNESRSARGLTPVDLPVLWFGKYR